MSMKSSLLRSDTKGRMRAPRELRSQVLGITLMVVERPLLEKAVFLHSINNTGMPLMRKTTFSRVPQWPF